MTYLDDSRTRVSDAPPPADRIDCLPLHELDAISVPPAIIAEIREEVALADPEVHLVTEHDLIKAAYPDSIPICTDAFMHVSRDHYSLPWLVREITQNFVDENRDHPASLDGVEFKHEEDGGAHRFTITGNWPFEDPTGLISLHSGKVKTDRKKAGGNGIGLKQTVLRFLRDYGVDEFNIVGEGWKVTYKMASKQSANERLKASTVRAFNGHEIENDWLLASVEKSENKGRCVYDVKTSNPEVASALDGFVNLGVSVNNEYLKNPDYQNQHGSFRWIPFKSPPPSFRKMDQKDLVRGRIFINGQVMNYRDKGKTPETYWDGPEFVNISLNDLDYDMSMDRPPVDAYSLRDYVSALVSGMNERELVDQLKKSEYLWSNLNDEEYGGERSAAFVLISKFVHELAWSHGYHRNPKKFKGTFGENYLHQDKTLSEKEQAELIEKGYKLCPKYFDGLGVPPASGKLDALEQAKKERPETPDMRWMATREGIQVGFGMPALKKPSDFFSAFTKRFSGMIRGMEIVDESKRRILIQMPMDFDEDLLYQQMFTRPKNDRAVDLYDLRGFIYYGIKHGIFNDVIISNGEKFVTFGLVVNEETGEEKFLTKVPEGTIAPGLHSEISEKEWVRFLKTFNSEAAKLAREKAEVEAKAIAKREREEAKATARREKEARSKEKRESSTPHYYFRKLVWAMGTAFGVLGIWWCVNNADFIANKANQLSNAVSQNLANAGSAGPSETQQYRDWLKSGKSYGANNGNKSSGKSLADIMADYNNSGVEGKKFIFTPTIEPPETTEPGGADVIENFEIIKNPSESQLKQLELLRNYIYLTTGINVNNILFLYKGEGAYGVNMGGHGIGIHANLLNVEFDEALSTFVHEVAHNKFMDHGLHFQTLNSLLHTAIHDTLAGIAQKQHNGGEVTEKESQIVQTEAQWDALRSE